MNAEIFNILQDIFSWLFIPSTSPIDPIQQAWLPVAIAIASLAASAYGQVKKAQADKKLQSMQEGVNAKMNSLSDYYNAESSKDFFDTDVAQSTIAKIKDQYKESLDTNKSNAVKGGLTAEAQVANQTSLQDKYNDALVKLSGYGTQYRDNMKGNYERSLGGLYSNNLNTYGPASQSWGNFSANAGQVAGSAIESTDWDKVFGKE